MLQPSNPHDYGSTTSVLDAITALGTAAAVLVALAAVAVGWHVANRDRKHSRLVERQRALIDLLAAFEAMQAYQVPAFGKDGELTTWSQTHPREFEEIRARWRASLYASGEDLPYTRRAAFDHFGPGPLPDGARLEGNPEIDTDAVRAIRGEIVDVLDLLRTQIEG
ncbi:MULTISPECIES: hypothetical protein [unclassified Nocardioides]|uniref:hypothetical protein n=1 Tax=unclassified Nocardioides TaxID=2615069 RepID=UPI0009EFC0F1|nr:MULTISPECIES: hypothetical protein [unclassified Nocardioides]GAW48200.1 hypothetical protein PD653B2_0513 [Nocardioides sp. PD653-B2]GAW57406.1 hypothetical protein PD653_4851 [Nocardioides sp. PD653]